MESALEAVIPIVLFLCIFGAFALHRYYRFRAQQESQETLRRALEGGVPLSPETIDALAQPPLPGDDRRRGVLALGLALALIAFALLLGEEDAVGPLAGIACFPLFLSFGYFWLSRGQKDD